MLTRFNRQNNPWFTANEGNRYGPNVTVSHYFTFIYYCDTAVKLHPLLNPRTPSALKTSEGRSKDANGKSLAQTEAAR